MPTRLPPILALDYLRHVIAPRAMLGASLAFLANLILLATIVIG